MTGLILTLNSGSSSLKFAVYRPVDFGELTEKDCVLHGAIDEVGEHSGFRAFDNAGNILVDETLPAEISCGDRPARGVRNEVIIPCLEWIEAHIGSEVLIAAGHRILHGGPHYTQPTRFSKQVLADLTALIPLAPLHQPACLAPVSTLEKTRPDLQQFACFDTNFHQTLPEVAKRLPLPRRYSETGVRRYGFHGLSYAYIASRLPEIAPDIATGRVIVAHLGNGASLCALRNGVSIETTMSLTALDGLIMGTRTGAIDPGAVIYMLQTEQRSADDVVDILYRQSGLLGISGVSSDMRLLRKENGNSSVKQAIELFTYRIVQEIGALIAVLGGLDALVFTAGIGEHDAALRHDVCSAFAWMGIVLDQSRNDQMSSVISAEDSKICVFVEPTNENLMICRAVLGCLNESRSS